MRGVESDPDQHNVSLEGGLHAPVAPQFLRGPGRRTRRIRTDSASHSGLWIAARGHEEYQAQAAQGTAAPRRPELPPGVKAIRISSNENPLGPGKAALDAIAGKFPEAGRYPFNSTPADSALVNAIATKFNVKPENIVLGAGSQEILKSAVRAFTSPTRGLVTASPSFENCPGIGAEARSSGHRDQS